MIARAKRPFEIRGWHVLTAILAFFALVIGVNVAFTIAALNSFPGEDVKRSYLQGLHYNDTLAGRRAQDALGWRAALSIEPSAEGPMIVLHIVDRSADGVPALQITGALRRPADAGMDRAITFTEIGGGAYRAPAPELTPGFWDVRINAARAADCFVAERRILWRP